jgi:hypothetical protein
MVGSPARTRWAPDYPLGVTDEELEELERALLEGWNADLIRSFLQMYGPSIADDEELKLWWRKWVLSSSSPGALQALRRMNSSIDVRHVLSSISAPTLVLHPVDDQVIALGGGEYIASHVPGAELIRLPGAEHGWWVRAEEIGEHSERFLREVWDRGEWDVIEPDRLDRLLEAPLPGGRVDLGPVGVGGPALAPQLAAGGVADHHLAGLGRGVDPGDQGQERAPSRCSTASWSRAA